MNPKEVFDKYVVEYKNKFEEELVVVIYFEDDIPVFIIIFSNILSHDDVLKKVPDEWWTFNGNKDINIISTPHPLDIFDKHAEKVDYNFDDGLILRYINFGKPTYDIQFDESLNCEEIREGLPADWIKLEKYGIVDIIIRKVEIPEFQNSDQFKDIKDHFNKRIDGLLEKLI